METILGSSTNEWRISGGDDYKIGDVDGTLALSAGPKAVILTALSPLPVDTEVMVRFRLVPAAGKTATLCFYSGLTNANDVGDNPLTASFTRPATAEETVSWSLPALPGHKSGDSGDYVVRSRPKDRSAWPEMVRKRAEDEYATTPPLAKRWLTLRYVIREHDARIWLDGRMLRESKGVGIVPEGHIRIYLYEGAWLASVRVRSLPPEDPLFESVQIEGYLNASKIKGDKLQRDSPPAANKPVTISGVPFVFPAPDARSNDHIDVGRSWMKFGLLEGAFAGWAGELSRWHGAMYCDPGRIQLRFRNAQYSKLHLIASYQGETDTSPVVTAQFYRPDSGFPVSFSARIEKGEPHLVTIPLEPEGLASLADLSYLELELTKEARLYRSFPDPSYYSCHGAGLPSGVHIYAVTLERPAVEVNFQPDKFAHVWTAPEKPSYTVHFRNNSSKDREEQIELSTLSHGAIEKTSSRKTVRVPAGGEEMIRLPIEIKRFGNHQVELQVKDEAGVRTQTRGLAYLHPDTRERGNWEDGKGTLFGFWDWYGSHITPGGLPHLEVMVAAGVESSMRPLTPSNYTAEELAYAEAHGMMTHFLAYQLKLSKELLGVDPDLTKPAEMEAALIQGLRKSSYDSQMLTPTRTNKPEFAVIFAEPLLGPISYMSLPEYYGDSPYQMTAEEEKNYKQKLDEFLIMARAIKKTWPDTKCLMPWGIPSFPIAFLRNSKEATELMDGPAIDLILFERQPEMQCHQVTYASTMWQLKQEWLKAGKKWPNLITVEGACTSPAIPGAMTMREEADHTIRGALLLAAYGVTRQLGWPTPFCCASAWGESHYGSGMCERMPLLSPKPFYCAYATMTRQLNRMNYVKAIETGSASVFCLQFKHYKTGELLHVFWTVRGARPVTVAMSRGSRVMRHDQMDNEIVLEEKDGKVTFPISTSPCYVRGLEEDARITMGTPDHSDSKPARNAMKLANPGDGSWKISEEHDNDYETVHLEFIKKFPAKMSISQTSAPSEAGGKALSIHLEKQEKERKTMPFYTTLVSSKPIAISGKASHLGLWVKAASDWGRVVYCLRDAKGERWLSVGKKDDWNNDDMHCWSAFNFDGWRYLRFELPGNEPYDCYRDAGTSFWGYYGKGDGIVDLPLTLEKIIVERRTHVIKVDELMSANPEDVLLGDLFVEYEKPADKTDEAVRLSRLRMGQVEPAPAVSPAAVKPKSAEEQNPFR